MEYGSESWPAHDTNIIMAMLEFDLGPLRLSSFNVVFLDTCTQTLRGDLAPCPYNPTLPSGEMQAMGKFVIVSINPRRHLAIVWILETLVVFVFSGA